ncbi:MAG: IS66 family insertion sequence element accessory protein TnpB [Albidovulum sp.]|nr:IS66 family insertion sequence element accessory protein TnpB [Albidovulum sp.]
MPANVPEGGIWLATRPADMRKSFDGLAAPVRNELGGDVVSGGWFVFADRRRTMMKIIGFGPGGCWIWAGGSSRGCSRFPPARGASPSRCRGPISRPCWTGSTSPPSAAASATRVRASPGPEKSPEFADFLSNWRFWRLTGYPAPDIVAPRHSKRRSGDGRSG